ncbi:hypothetical protein D915_006682 [Fasciola hepatica]|uniref:PX domain-containing protein n=1 Tax=Fasciola hepatica TaxID=6192 RepID=A0A4E0R6X7_FASHE|nr:hypothetical protein D915_006682 [Fasciola hepatica]
MRVFISDLRKPSGLSISLVEAHRSLHHDKMQSRRDLIAEGCSVFSSLLRSNIVAALLLRRVGQYAAVLAPGVNENGKILLWSVNRRYSQFAALRKALRSLHPISILPPLPNKTDVVSAFQENLSRRKRLTNHVGSLQLIDHIVSSGRLDARLIDYRCRALQYFLQHVLLHRQSSLAAVVRDFLKDADVSEKLREIAGHELDSFSSLMDTAEEEEAELMEKYDFLSRYADSLEEMHEAYQTVQTNSSRKSRSSWSPHKTIEGTIDSFAPPSGPERQSVNVPEASKHTVGVAPACMDVLWETLHFESVHQSDLNELFYAYACLQLRRAERCKRMWERVTTSLQLAAEGISLSQGN